jgi:hypothetical protein
LPTWRESWRSRGRTLDVGYIERWARELGLLDLWQQVAGDTEKGG